MTKKKMESDILAVLAATEVVVAMAEVVVTEVVTIKVT